MKKCFIICWFGKLPNYFEIWLKTCAYNQSFDFLIMTDNEIELTLPYNVKKISFSLKEFVCRVKNILNCNVSMKKAYRICDFRPLYGEVFKEELQEYDFWGYCDVDVIFGKLNDYITDSMLNEYEAIFNCGHLTLLKNIDRINQLYKEKGSAFSFDTVSSHDAIFAFDERTGIQRIAAQNNIRAQYLIPYIEAEIKYHQLRSRLDKTNPDYQAYYWEKGNLFRVKLENDQIYYQKQAYIHLQKRKIEIDLSKGAIGDSFWITPEGYVNKPYLGQPSPEDIMKTNPYEGKKALRYQSLQYMNKKIISILKRTPYQIYVRLVQAKYGINGKVGSLEERPWERY